MTTPKNRAIVYVDGFNFYHGLRAKYGRKYLWLNLEMFAQAIAPIDTEIVVTKYFTSKIRGFSDDPDKPKRQFRYLRAIKTLEPRVITIWGRYQLFPSHCRFCDHEEIFCRCCGQQYQKPNEKKTDVNIATHLFVDNIENNCDIQILISGDSDFENTLVELKKLFPRKELIVAFPPKRRNNKLLGEDKCTASLELTEDMFSDSLFPDIVTRPGKKPIEKPPTWV